MQKRQIRQDQTKNERLIAKKTTSTMELIKLTAEDAGTNKTTEKRPRMQTVCLVSSIIRIIKEKKLAKPTRGCWK